MKSSDFKQLMQRMFAVLIDYRPHREHELLKLCEDLPIFDGIDEQADLALFQRHFILKHALYRLRRSLRESETGVLEISAVVICLYPWSEDSAQTSLQLASASESLEDYYLNLENLAKETDESVAALLTDFWSAFTKYEAASEADVSAAAETLDVPWPCDLTQLKRAFRVKAQVMHPDKGGDAAAVSELHESFEMLRARVH